MLRIPSANRARGSRRNLGEDGGGAQRCRALKRFQPTNKTYFVGSAAASLKGKKNGTREVTPVVLWPPPWLWKMCARQLQPPDGSSAMHQPSLQFHRCDKRGSGEKKGRKCSRSQEKNNRMRIRGGVIEPSARK